MEGIDLRRLARRALGLGVVLLYLAAPVRSGTAPPVREETPSPPQPADALPTGESALYQVEMHVLLGWVPLGKSRTTVMPPVLEDGEVFRVIRAEHTMERFREGTVLEEIRGRGPHLEIVSSHISILDGEGRVEKRVTYRLDRDAGVVRRSDTARCRRLSVTDPPTSPDAPGATGSRESTRSGEPTRSAERTRSGEPTRSAEPRGGTR